MRRDLVFVYGVTLLGMAAPALLLVLLVRVLAPGAYGQLAAVQGVAVFLGVLADFGLIYSGSAAVARAREHPQRLGHTVAAGLALRGAGALLSAPLALAVLGANPLLSERPGLPLLGALLTLAYALSPAWLLWGLDRQRELALAEHGPRILLLLLVAGAALARAARAETVLALQVAAVAGVYLALWGRLVPALHLRRPSAALLRTLAGDALRLFLYRALAAGFTNLNPYLLGLAATPEAVGAFAAAERVVRAGLQLAEPLLRYHLPKLQGGERRRERRFFLELAGLSGVLWLLFQLAAGPLLALLLGPRLLASEVLRPVFTLLSFLLLLHPLSKARLLAGVFARGKTSRALALQAVAFAFYAAAALVLYSTGRLGPLTLAGLLVAVEGLLLLLTFTQGPGGENRVPETDGKVGEGEESERERR